MAGMLAAMHRSQLDAMAPAIDPSTPHGLFADSCDAHVESSTGCRSTESKHANCSSEGKCFSTINPPLPFSAFDFRV